MLVRTLQTRPARMLNRTEHVWNQVERIGLAAAWMHSKATIIDRGEIWMGWQAQPVEGAGNRHNFVSVDDRICQDYLLNRDSERIPRRLRRG